MLRRPRADQQEVCLSADASGSRFPSGFLWGAATSAYQIEGSPLADGAGPSIWYRFSRTPGRTIEGPVGDTACDHYRRYSEDVALMADLGLQAYRFSIAWSRVMPSGRGAVNARGLDFYSRLVDALLARGIQPNATLFHWDLPAALDDLGGWLNPDCVSWFADYASAVFERLGDRVEMWATLNEPWVIAHDGYASGCNAPGHRNLFEAPRVAHHLLCAHGAAVQRYRAARSSKGKIGIVVNLVPVEAATSDAADVAAAARMDSYINQQYLDPVLLGRYPEDLPAIYGEGWPSIAAKDLELIRQPIDWVGINYYTRRCVRHDDSQWPERAGIVQMPGRHTETGWEVHPESFTKTLCWVRERYGSIPQYVTENGAAFADPPRAVGGRIDDPLRVDYLRTHLLAAREAMRRGVDLRGYFVWSLLDNVEWSSGRTKRFGIVHMDYETQKRTPKASAEFYREVIRSEGAALDKPLSAKAG
jgi:beta-glucosidase